MLIYIYIYIKHSNSIDIKYMYVYPYSNVLLVIKHPNLWKKKDLTKSVQGWPKSQGGRRSQKSLPKKCAAIVLVNFSRSSNQNSSWSASQLVWVPRSLRAQSAHWFKEFVMICRRKKVNCLKWSTCANQTKYFLTNMEPYVMVAQLIYIYICIVYVFMC